MKSLITLLLIVVTILVSALQVTSQICGNFCTADVNYVCGNTRRNGRTIYCTFTNKCTLDLHACSRREIWGFSNGRCRQDSSRNDCR